MYVSPPLKVSPTALYRHYTYTAVLSPPSVPDGTYHPVQVHVQATLPSLGFVHQFTLSALGQANLVHTLRCLNGSMHQALHPIYPGGTKIRVRTRLGTPATVPTALTNATESTHTTMVCDLSTLEYVCHGNMDATFSKLKILPLIHDHELDNLIPHHAIYASNRPQVTNLYLGLGPAPRQLHSRLHLSPVQSRVACQVTLVQAQYTGAPSKSQKRPHTMLSIPTTYLSTRDRSTALQS